MAGCRSVSVCRTLSLVLAVAVAQPDLSEKVHRTDDFAPMLAAEKPAVTIGDEHIDMHDPQELHREQAAHLSTRVRNYDLLPSVRYHGKLRKLSEEGNGAIVAFVDEKSVDYIPVEGVLNRAAAAFRCLPPGGVHLVKVRESKDATRIADTFHAEYKIAMREGQKKMDLPFVAYIRATNDELVPEPISWISGRTNWTVPSLKRWAYALWNVTYLDDELDAKVLTQRLWSASYANLVVGVFDRLCEGDASTFLEAMALQREQGDPLPAAVSTNRTLAEIARPLAAASPPTSPSLAASGRKATAVFAVANGGTDQWFPETDLTRRAKELADWLGEVDVWKKKPAAARPHDEL